MCKGAGVGVVVPRSQVDVAGERVISLPVIGRFNGLRMFFLHFLRQTPAFIPTLLVLRMGYSAVIMIKKGSVKSL